MPDEKLTAPTTTGNSLSPSINWYKNSKCSLIFNRSCLKQIKETYTPANAIIFFIVSELGTWPRDLNSDFTSKDCLFGGVKLTKNAFV